MISESSVTIGKIIWWIYFNCLVTIWNSFLILFCMQIRVGSIGPDETFIWIDFDGRCIIIHCLIVLLHTKVAYPTTVIAVWILTIQLNDEIIHLSCFPKLIVHPQLISFQLKLFNAHTCQHLKLIAFNLVTQLTQHPIKLRVQPLHLLLDHRLLHFSPARVHRLH